MAVHNYLYHIFFQLRQKKTTGEKLPLSINIFTLGFFSFTSQQKRCLKRNIQNDRSSITINNNLAFR